MWQFSDLNMIFRKWINILSNNFRMELLILDHCDRSKANLTIFILFHTVFHKSVSLTNLFPRVCIHKVCSNDVYIFGVWKERSFQKCSLHIGKNVNQSVENNDNFLREDTKASQNWINEFWHSFDRPTM